MNRERLSQPAPDALAATELFRGLSARALSDIARHAVLTTFRRGERIFAQGEPAHHAHVLIRGRVKIVQSGAGGEQLVVRFIRTGETFGTVGLYVDGLYPAEAIAADQVVEARWRARGFQLLVQKHPEIALNLLQVAAARLQELQLRLRELSTERAEHRVASTLLRMALRERQVNPDERVLPLSRRDIAELAGTTMYTASRILSGWEREGIAVSGRSKVKILRPDALAARISAGR